MRNWIIALTKIKALESICGPRVPETTSGTLGTRRCLHLAYAPIRLSSLKSKLLLSRESTRRACPSRLWMVSWAMVLPLTWATRIRCATKVRHVTPSIMVRSSSMNRKLWRALPTSSSCAEMAHRTTLSIHLEVQRWFVKKLSKTISWILFLEITMARSTNKKWSSIEKIWTSEFKTIRKTLVRAYSPQEIFLTPNLSESKKY